MPPLRRWLHQLSLVRDLTALTDIASQALSAISGADKVDIHFFGTKASPVKDDDQGWRRMLQAYCPENIPQIVGASELFLTQGALISPNNFHQALLVPLGIANNAGLALLWFSASVNQQNTSPITDNEPLNAPLSSMLILADSIALTWLHVTHQVSLAQQLAQKSVELHEIQTTSAQAHRIKDRFLSATSHDLRQPLQQINNLASVLQKQVEHPENRKLIDRIRRLTSDMDAVLRTLLNLDKLARGIVEPEKSVFPLSQILATLNDDFQMDALHNGLRLNITPGSAEIFTDRDMLLQILRNLMSNAIKYTREGEILVSESIEADNLILCIKDTGPGISAQHQKIMFEPFCKLHDEDDSASFGLGLSIVKALCETLKMPLNVSSVPGQGTEFQLTIPFSAASHTEPHFNQKEIVTAELPGRSNILYLEDDVILMESMSLLLEMAGFTVIAAANFEQAIEKMTLSNLIPDVLLFDKNLQNNEDGLMAIRSLRRKVGRNIPAILLTGYTEYAKNPDAVEVADRVLTKPIDADLLITEISEILAKQKSS